VESATVPFSIQLFYIVTDAYFSDGDRIKPEEGVLISPVFFIGLTVAGYC